MIIGKVVRKGDKQDTVERVEDVVTALNKKFHLFEEGMGVKTFFCQRQMPS